MNVSKEKFSKLERVIISAFDTTIHQLHFYSSSQFSNFDYTEIGKKMELLFIKNDVQSILEDTQYELQNHAYTSYETRLAVELDCQLFSLFLHQYDEKYSCLYNEPCYSYLLHSLGCFSELLYRLYVDPENTKAPADLSMVYKPHGSYI